MTDVSVSAVVGNPKVASRTLTVVEAIARAVAGAAGTDSVETVDLGVFGPRVLDLGDEEVGAALARLLEADIVVVGSPTYKATYTGLLKGFLDRIQGPGLAGVLGVPVMVAATPIHYLAIEFHLRPLLVEMGASCPTAGFFLTEGQLGELDARVQEWLEGAAGRLLGALAHAGGQL